MTSPYYQYGLELAGGTVRCSSWHDERSALGFHGERAALNQWNYLAVVFDGAQACTYYLNGHVCHDGVLPATHHGTRQSVSSSGADSNPAQFFKGSLDDVRIYGRALTAAEIQTDMLTPVGTIGSGDPNPPDVQLNQPADGAAVSDIVVVGALATDDVGVAGVQFYRRRGADGLAGYGCSLCADVGHADRQQRRPYADGPGVRYERQCRPFAARDGQRLEHQLISETRSWRPASICRPPSNSCPMVACLSLNSQAPSKCCRRRIHLPIRPLSCS